MEVILDTSFILTCLKEGVDFLEASEYGKLLLPELVLLELEKLRRGKGRRKEQASLALTILEKNKDKFNIISLEKKYADAGIKKYVENAVTEGKRVIVATMDKELKEALKGRARILVIRARKKLGLV